MRSDLGAAQSDLFLNRESCLDLQPFRRVLEKFRQDHHSQTVVQCFSVQRSSDPLKRSGEGCTISNLHLVLGRLFLGGADIDSHCLNFYCLLELFAGRQMDGLPANHSRHSVLSDPDRLA